MMLFWRRLKRASRRIGANLRFISIVASVALPSGSSSTSVDLADLHTRDPHLGRRHEVRGLGQRDLELVAARLERERT